jgi:hypothetical protein
MAKVRLSRRAVLRGAGSIAIALPWLEAMQPTRTAHAQTLTPAKRFLHVYTPGGTVLSKWKPTGTETAPVLSPILKPLEAVKSKILVVGGMDMKCALGEQHQAGIVGLLTGTSQGTAGKYAPGPSVDQVLASRLSAGKKKASIQVAIRWATGKSKGLLSPINSLNFEAAAPYNPIPPRLDPQQIFNDLFGSLPTTGMTPTTSVRDGHRKSILDFVNKKYTALLQKVGADDKQKIQQHLDKIREIEKSIEVVTTTTASCKAPTLVSTTDYNPTSGKNSANDGSLKDTSTDAAIPKVGKLLTDMLVMALACDITGVATLQWSDTEAKHTFPWLSLSEHHHFYQHDGGFKPVECEKICTWYSEQHKYLIESMAGVDMGGHSLLDESIVFFGSEIQEPPIHSKTNMPFMLAGNGGGLRTGRYVQYSGQPHNNLLLSILNLFGDTRTTFGDPKFCTGALANLT